MNTKVHELRIFTGLPNPVGICVSFVVVFLFISFHYFFPVSVKVFCAYFVRFEGAWVMRRFPWCTQENI